MMKLIICSDSQSNSLTLSLFNYIKNKFNYCSIEVINSTNKQNYLSNINILTNRLKQKKIDKLIFLEYIAASSFIYANKITEVRAVSVINEFQVKMARKHNDANVICLPTSVLAPNMLQILIEVFLLTEFENGRHQSRINLLDK